MKCAQRILIASHRPYTSGHDTLEMKLGDSGHDKLTIKKKKGWGSFNIMILKKKISAVW